MPAVEPSREEKPAASNKTKEVEKAAANEKGEKRSETLPSQTSLELTAKVQAIRNEASHNSSEQLKDLLNEQIASGLTRDISNLDKAQLQERAKQLSTELKDKTSLEAVGLFAFSCSVLSFFLPLLSTPNQLHIV